MRRHHAANLLTAIGIASCVMFGVPAAGQSIGVDHAAQPRPSDPNERGPYLFLAIAEPIQETTLMVWEEMLLLSEPQAAMLRALYDDYVRQEIDVRLRELIPLWDWSAELGALEPDDYSNPSVIDELTRFVTSSSKFTQDMLARERSLLIDRLIPVLSDGQLESLPDAVDYRLRQVYSVARCPHRAASIDLVDILYYLSDENGLGVRDRKACDSTLRAYSRNATVLRHNYFDKSQELAMERVAAAGARGTSKTDRLRNRVAQLGRRMVEMTDRYAEEISRWLSDESAEQFLKLYRETAHPQVFPNPYDCAPLIAELIEDGDIVADVRDQLTTLWIDSSLRQETVCRQMMTEILVWIDQYIAEGRIDGVEAVGHRARLAELNESRRAIFHETTQIILGLFSEDDSRARLIVAEHRGRSAGPVERSMGALYYYPAYYGPRSLSSDEVQRAWRLDSQLRGMLNKRQHTDG